VSPLKPKAKAVSILGVFQHRYHFSPKSRGGIGVPKPAKNASGLDTKRAGVGIRAGVADASAADHLAAARSPENGCRDFVLPKFRWHILAHEPQQRLAPP